MIRRSLSLLALAVLTLSCGGSSPTAPSETGSDCSTSGQIAFVSGVLQSWYYWYSELPSVDPASFSSAEAYLDAVRFRTLDETFSYITSRASSDAFFSDSQFIGFGLSYRRTGESELRADPDLPRQPRRRGRARSRRHAAHHHGRGARPPVDGGHRQRFRTGAGGRTP